jgi:FKBP-type peptidyl-prolyl cis-trans isomerase FklB
MKRFMRWLTHAAVTFALVASVPAALSQAAHRPPAAQADAVADIRLSYKRDPRVVDAFRGVGVWADGPNFTSANAQDTVETVARVLNSKGRLIRSSVEWIPSDAQMVTVSPDKGDHVKVTVHRSGESTLKISAPGFSRELTIRAVYSGQFITFQIAPESPRPAVASAPMDPALKGRKEQVSYAAGMRMAQTLRAQSEEIAPELVAQAIRDVLAGGPTMMSEEQVQLALMGVETQLNVTQAMVERKRVADQNKHDGERFLAENRQKGDVVTLPSGLQYKVIRAGDGRKPTLMDVAVCQYRGTLVDGTEFDSSYRKRGPVSFPLKAVIKGWQEALQLMPAGSKWELFVPPGLAYGQVGVPRARIPPNSTLIFDVELVAVRDTGSFQAAETFR